MEFRAIWSAVGDAEGRTFEGANGGPFRYRFKRTYIVTEPGGQSIPRTNFEKVFRRKAAGLDQKPAVQGQLQILAVLDGLHS